MKKRPLLGVLLLFILVIFIWYQTGNKDPVSFSAENVSVTGVVKEIQNTASGRRLILSDVLISGCRNTAENLHENEDKILCSKILVYDKKNESLFSDLKLGNSITLKGTVCSFSLPGNPGQFNEFEYYRQQNINYKMFSEKMLYKDDHIDRYQQYLYECREQLCSTIKQCMSAEEAGIVNAVLFGDKSELPQDIKLLYQRNGIAHLLAISGVKTLKLDIPLVPETRINWAFVPLHIAIIYILKLCLNEEIIPRCRFPCSRGYRKKYINWQKKQ